MNEPIPAPAPGENSSLWERAPAWRRLTIAASFLTLAAMVFLVLPPPQPQANIPLLQTAPVTQLAAATPGSSAPPSPIAPPADAHIAATPAPSQAQPITSTPVCALRQPASPRAMGLGTIIGLEDRALSLADIPRREARLGGLIDPNYVHDLRAVVRQDDGRVQTFDVPRGTTVRVGDRVTLQNSYRDPALSCGYIPILITADSGPAPIPQ